MSSCDLGEYFAKRLLKEEATLPRIHFLASLMRSQREGHLCLVHLDAPDLPASIMAGTESPIIRDGNRYYLARNWTLESHIIAHIERLQKIRYPAVEIAAAPLLEAQRRAIELSMQQGFSIISGGPGTGKTYTASVLVKSLARVHPQLKVVLTAPTGKAASHLQAVLGNIDAQVEAMTLHRLLGISPGQIRLSGRKIDADLIIVDEASMLDVLLLAELLGAVSDHTRLILMGDPDQLPPVDASSLFAEMAPLFGVRLTQSMRTDNAHLLQMASEVRNGTYRKQTPSPPFDSSVFGKIYELATPLISDSPIDPIAYLEKMGEFRILGALRQGAFGVDAINAFIVQEMGRRMRPGQWWALPILITKNAPRQDLYNGTFGVLVGQGRIGAGGIAYFPREVPFHHLPPFETAFCLSIHKSQGSEFGRVLALFPPGSEHFGKAALYTAVTRARSEVDLWIDPETLEQMLHSRPPITSGFTARILSKKELMR